MLLGLSLAPGTLVSPACTLLPEKRQVTASENGSVLTFSLLFVEQFCKVNFPVRPSEAPDSSEEPPHPGVPWACGCLAKLSGKCGGASRSLQFGKQAQEAGWRLGLALLRPHPEEHCVITEMQHHSSRPTPSDPARAAATSSRPGRVGDTQTWNDPHAMLGREIWQNLRKHQALGPERWEGAPSGKQAGL